MSGSTCLIGPYSNQPEEAHTGESAIGDRLDSKYHAEEIIDIFDIFDDLPLVDQAAGEPLQEGILFDVDLVLVEGNKAVDLVVVFQLIDEVIIFNSVKSFSADHQGAAWLVQKWTLSVVQLEYLQVDCHPSYQTQQDYVKAVHPPAIYYNRVNFNCKNHLVVWRDCCIYWEYSADW